MILELDDGGGVKGLCVDWGEPNADEILSRPVDEVVSGGLPMVVG